MKHVEVTKQCDVEHVYEQLITVTNSYANVTEMLFAINQYVCASCHFMVSLRRLCTGVVFAWFLLNGFNRMFLIACF